MIEKKIIWRLFFSFINSYFLSLVEYPTSFDLIFYLLQNFELWSFKKDDGLELKLLLYLLLFYLDFGLSHFWYHSIKFV